MTVPSVCSVSGCGLPVIARGWCNRHYRRWHRHGVTGGADRDVLPWTEAEKEILRRHYSHMPYQQLQELLPGRTVTAIRGAAGPLSDGRARRRRNWHDKPPVERPTLKDIAWAAGIYEGEGHVGRSARGAVTANVSQKDGWLPERLRQLFGGCTGHYASQSSLGNSMMWRWYLCGPRALGFLFTIYPLLSPRRRGQIRKALGWG